MLMPLKHYHDTILFSYYLDKGYIIHTKPSQPYYHCVSLSLVKLVDEQILNTEKTALPN